MMWDTLWPVVQRIKEIVDVISSDKSDGTLKPDYRVEKSTLYSLK